MKTTFPHQTVHSPGVNSHQDLAGTVNCQSMLCAVYLIYQIYKCFIPPMAKPKQLSCWLILFHSLPTLQNLNFPQCFPHSCASPWIFFRLRVIHSDFVPWTAKFCTKKTNRPNLCWILPMALLGFPQVLSQLPQCQFCMSVQGKKIKISEELISISHFSNWVCRFIPKTNPPVLCDHWMGAALRNPSKKSEASWSKCLPEIKRYSGTQFCLLYWELWPDKKITWQKAFTPFTCYFNISSRLLHKQKIFCILFSLCIGDTTLQIGAICEIRTIGNK